MFDKRNLVALGFGVIGTLVAILGYQAFLDHQRIKTHSEQIATIVNFLNQARSAPK